MGSIPGSGRSPSGENGNPLQYSCLEYLMDRGVWWVTVHRVPKSWAWLSGWAHAHNCLTMLCWFLLCKEVNQPYAFICPLSLVPPSHVPSSHPSRSAQSTMLSSLHCTVPSHQLSILHTAVFMSILLSICSTLSFPPQLKFIAEEFGALPKARKRHQWSRSLPCAWKFIPEHNCPACLWLVLS